MKNKLIATLVATTLQFHAAAALAQQAGGQCELPNGAAVTASGATPVSSGPLNPVDGFPEYLVDSNGVTVQRCLDANLCFFDPIDPADPFSLQIGSGGESFYWGADAIVTDPAGNRVLTLVMAAEAAIMQTNAAGHLLNGSQSAFLRQRFVMGVPQDGTYTVRHPYGVDVFTVVGATGARDVAATLDKGFAPNSTFTGTVGPFLVAEDAPNRYLGDNATPSRVTGSPCGRNHVELSGVDTLGQPVVWGFEADGITPITVLRTDRFNVQGRRYDGRVQTPLNATRLTYSRLADGTGQLETFTESPATASVTVNDGPTVAVNEMKYRGPEELDHLAVAAGGAIDSLAMPVVDATVLPPVVQLTASDTPTDTTTLNLPIVDFVDAIRAEYDPDTRVLAVAARSGDELRAPRLTLRGYGPFPTGTTSLVISDVTAPPAVVHIDSELGGTDSTPVIVAAPELLAAPGDFQVVTSLLSSRAVTVTWHDNSNNEAGYRVYATPAGGTQQLVATAGANATTARVTGLSPATTYTLVVEAYNLSTAAAADPVAISTPALPAAPGSAAAQLGTTTRRIDISWTASPDAAVTGYAVYRSDNASTPLAGASNLPAGTVAFADTTGPIDATVTYRVIALRDANGAVDASVATETVALTTPALPAAPSGVVTTVGDDFISVAWTGSATASGYQVYRRTGTGNFVAIGGLLPAGTTSYNDANLPGGTYAYRVDAVNWAGSTASAATANATLVVLRAVTNASATNAGTPVISWTDASIGETAYRVRRTQYTVNDTTGELNAGTPTVASNTIAGATGTGTRLSFTDSGATANRTYRYDIAALDGTRAGPLTRTGFVLAATNLPRPGTPIATVTLGTTTAQVALRWTALTNVSIGGYEILRCRAAVAGVPVCAAGSTLTKITGSAVNTAGTVDGRVTTTFTDTTAQRNTNYVYSMRAVGGAGTGIVGPLSLTGVAVTVR